MSWTVAFFNQAAYGRKMEPPAFDLGWTLFAVVALGAIIAAAHLVMQEVRLKKERAALLREAGENRDSAPPITEIEEYEEKREEIFQSLLREGKVQPHNEDLTEGVLPHSSWQREFLTTEDRTLMKRMLLKRALANIPRWVTISSEANSKFRLWKHGLLEEKAWMGYQQAHEDLQRELDYIRLEAECIEEGWGDTILRTSMMLYRHQEAQKARKRLQEAEQRQKEREAQRAVQSVENKKKTEQGNSASQQPVQEIVDSDRKLQKRTVK